MRKWTKSACAVLAWCILPILVWVGVQSSLRPAQAIHRIAISTAQVTLTNFTGVAEPAPTVRYIVQPGDTLSSIATALAVRGGWQALYTASKQAIGPNPNIIRVGTALTIPFLVMKARPASQARSARPSASLSKPAGHAHRPAPPTMRSTSLTVASGMPQWLRAMLLAAGIVIGLALLAEPVIAMGRRRTRDRRRRRAVEKAGIVMADHERLIVTYSLHDDTVYVLTPPGEDPRAVLRAARLVVPEEKYEELAGQLGVSASWPPE
ncbi:MAG: hypothetical protein JWM19_7632 [Actinomycetia bacterium]|nr:hypothetical protein [Actinomycetes bacterium]